LTIFDKVIGKIKLCSFWAHSVEGGLPKIGLHAMAPKKLTLYYYFINIIITSDLPVNEQRTEPIERA